ncbi:methyltransferase domain-containing protein [Paenibacillus dendritiformis]|uniref:methyltransferase domain-containing protein n=1 Tax=Paenibacillus dendritiformis TaxID=130049 RepID=UPI0036575A2A
MIEFLEVYPQYRNNKIIVWGTGQFYRECKKKIDFPIYCFIDNDFSMWGQEIDGKLIFGPEILNELDIEEVLIIILNSFHKEIRKQLRGHKLAEGQILNWEQIEFDVYKYKEQVVEGLDEVNQKMLAHHQCNLCGCSEFELLYHRARDLKIVLNYICMNCGFVFTFPRITSKQHENLYANGHFSKIARKKTIPDEEKFKFTEHQAYIRLKLLEKIASNLLYKDGSKNMVEIGSETGSFLQLMDAIGWKVTGLEPDSKYAQSSRERYQLDIQDITIESNDLPKEFYDFICSFQVIEHVDDVTFFVKQINNLLKNEGYVFIECPGIDNMHTRIDDFFWDVHINTFSETVLRALLQKEGFKIVDSGYNELGFLWVLGQKTNETQTVKFEKPQRIKNIVSSTITPNRVNAEKVAVTPINQPTKYKIAHVGIHRNTNAGDTVLFPYVRKVFQKEIGNIEFSLIDIHDRVTKDIIHEINQMDALLIGGGGVFLSDTNPNNKSGWQWPCSSAMLEQINVPIIVYSVGYNRFRGQPEFEPIFKDNITTLIKKSVFFGVRNYGSLKALKSYIPEEYWCKLKYQPCPTTIIEKLDGVRENKNNSSKSIALNLALDRPFMRFGNRQRQILSEIANAVKKLQKDGWRVVLYHHHLLDEKCRLWFFGEGLQLEEVDLNQTTPEKVLQSYDNIDICIGMRGHAQMIPFGLGKPILSIVSHDKLQFFLDDINHPEWGIDVKSNELGEQIYNFISKMNLEEIKEEIKLAQNQLWHVTHENINYIKKFF